MSPRYGQKTLPGLEPLDPHSAAGPLDDWTVYAIDANSLIFQVFHALPEMTSPRGEPVGAVYGFARDLLFLIEEKKPDCLLCAFDLPGPTFRHALFDQYKADRGEMPEELAAQLPIIRTLLQTLNIPILEAQGFEADDILATVAERCDTEGARCYVVTGDKDCRQLISPRVSVYNIRKDHVYTAEDLQKDWGVRPDQVVDFQALVGDPTDNIPGVPLIGPKLAGQLLASYDTLDGVLKHADEVQGEKRRENLLRAGPIVEISRQLVQLHRNVPVPIDFPAGRIGGFDADQMARLVPKLGFGGLGERLRSLVGSPQPEPERPTADYHIVDTPEALDDFLAKLSRQKRFSVDTETTHRNPRWAEIVGYSFCWEAGEAYYLPVRGPAGQPQLDPLTTLAALRPFLEDPQIAKVGQNLKYDMVVLRGAGVLLAGARFDTMLASYLLAAGERNHSLDELAERYLNHTTIKIESLIGKGKTQKRMDQVAIDLVGPYAAEDAELPLRLEPLLAERLSEWKLTDLFDDVEMPLIDVLAEMEFSGIRVNATRLDELSGQFGERLDRLQTEITELAGHELNIASPKQLARVLFDELGLPVVKKTKTGPSTDAEVLAELADQHPLPAKIIQYRQYAKLKNGYVDALPSLVHPETGRVHASLNQVVAATGRLSASDPNLQNIPVRTDEGREIRSAFVADEGWVLLSADYSQIELRVLAHFTADPVLCAAFAAGEDIHASVASRIYGVPVEEVTWAMRHAAKAVNFGVIYGQSPFGLGKSLGIDQEEAAQFIEEYFARYAQVEQFLAKTLDACRHSGYVNTLLGRRRAIRGVRPDANRARNLAERTAINTVIQGSAADLIKLAMIAIHRRLGREKPAVRMLLQIHDELLFEVRADVLDQVAPWVVEEMTGVWKLEVPLAVDLKSGQNWADCQPLNIEFS